MYSPVARVEVYGQFQWVPTPHLAKASVSSCSVGEIFSIGLLDTIFYGRLLCRTRERISLEKAYLHTLLFWEWMYSLSALLIAV